MNDPQQDAVDAARDVGVYVPYGYALVPAATDEGLTARLLDIATAIVNEGIRAGATDEQIARRVLDAARAGEGLREALRDIRNIAASLGGPLPDIYRLEIFAIADRTLAALHPDTADERSLGDIQASNEALPATLEGKKP